MEERQGQRELDVMHVFFVREEVVNPQHTTHGEYGEWLEDDEAEIDDIEYSASHYQRQTAVDYEDEYDGHYEHSQDRTLLDTSKRKPRLHMSCRWRPQVLAVLFVLFVAVGSRTIVLPIMSTLVAQLGGTKAQLGLSFSLFSVGRLVGAPILGWWYNRRGALEVLSVAMLIGATGGVMFWYAPWGGIYMLLASRTVIGFATGSLSVVRAHIAAQSTPEERTRYMGYTGVTQIIGFSLMPGINILFADIDVHVGRFELNPLTTPGFATLVMHMAAFLLNFVLFSSLLDSPLSRSRDAQPPLALNKDTKALEREKDDLDSYEDEERLGRHPAHEFTCATQEQEKGRSWWITGCSQEQQLELVGALVFLLLNFVGRGVASLIESLGTPLFLAVVKDSTTDAAHFFLVLGVAGLPVYFGLPYALKVVHKVVALIFGFVVIGAGLITIAAVERDKLTETQLVVGAGLMLSLGSPIVQTLVLSSFSTILGSKPQGTLMALLSMAGSLGRIVFPLFITMLDERGSFVVGSAFSVASIVGIVCYSAWVKCVTSQRISPADQDLRRPIN